MTHAVATALERLLPPGRVLVDAAAIAPFVHDWRRKFTGTAACVVQPTTAAEVSAIVTLCRTHGAAVIPQGGNTGLCGGATPPAQGPANVVVSFAKMNKVRAVDRDNGTVTVEAGCVLADIQALAEANDRLFPLSLAAEGSAQIGGVLSTNAGGTAVLRYGNARDLVLGVEVVLADGRIWDGLRGLRKDNTGYDLKQCFIGSEGTLGLITAAVLKLFPRPRQTSAALVGLASAANAVALLRRTQDGCGDRLTGFEVFTRGCLDTALRHAPRVRDPFEAPHEWYALVELNDTWRDAPLAAMLEDVLAAAHDAGEIEDAVIAASDAQRKDMWRVRESISEAQGKDGYTLKHDITLPIGAIPAFIEETSALIERAYPGTRIGPFGHLGDGNIHYNIAPPVSPPGRPKGEHRSAQHEGCLMSPPGRPKGEHRSAQHEGYLMSLPEVERAIARIVYDRTAAAHGSFSAEHGIGQLKLDEVERYKSAVERDLFAMIKRALDPAGALNPGKVLRAS